MRFAMGLPFSPPDDALAGVQTQARRMQELVEPRQLPLRPRSEQILHLRVTLHQLLAAHLDNQRGVNGH